MPTLSAGGAATITLPIGATVTFSPGGNGVVVFGPGQMANNTVGVGTGQSTFGPYQYAQTLYVSASSPVTYSVSGVTTGPQLTGSTGALRGSIECASNIFAVSKYGSGGGTQNRTWQCITDAWGAFNAVQPVFINPTASTATVENCTIAASANSTNAIVPTGAWSAATGALTVPAGSAANPGYLVAPKIPLKSIPRDDGGSFPLLYCRTFFQTGNTTYAFGSGGSSFAAANWGPRSEGHTLIGANVAGDAVTTPGSWTSGSFDANPIFVPAGFIFTYDQAMTSVAAIGDSIMAGDFGTTTSGAPYAFKAVTRLSAAGMNVSWINCGFSGQTMVNINARGRAVIDNFAPDIVIIPAYTINSAVSTQSDWDSQWYYAMDLAQYQLKKGRRVLFVTPYPNNGLSAVTDGYRQTQRQRVINSGIPYADIEGVASDGGYPAKWQSGLNFDATHPNDLGHNALAPVVRAALLQII